MHNLIPNLIPVWYQSDTSLMPSLKLNFSLCFRFTHDAPSLAIVEGTNLANFVRAARKTKTQWEIEFQTGYQTGIRLVSDWYQTGIRLCMYLVVEHKLTANTRTVDGRKKSPPSRPPHPNVNDKNELDEHDLFKSMPVFPNNIHCKVGTNQRANFFLPADRRS